jgi:hypothetical protein
MKVASDDTKGYDSKAQKAEQLEALKTEHAMHVRLGRTDRAREVAAYTKQYHGETLSTPRAAKADEE